MKKIVITLIILLVFACFAKLIYAGSPPGFPDDSNTIDNETALMRVSNAPNVYEIKNGVRHWIPTAAIFNSYGFDWNDIEVVSATTLNAYSRVKLLRATSDEKVYYLTESGMIRHIPTAEIFVSYNNDWNDIFEVSSAEINAYEKNNLIRAQGDYKVYFLGNGQKRWIRTAEAFNRLKYDWFKIAPVNQTEINYYPLGAEIN